jgi:atlastin
MDPFGSYVYIPVEDPVLCYTVDNLDFTGSETDLGKPKQVITIKDHKLHLDVDALKEILHNTECKSLPVAVVSVAGAYRTGKSFLLDFFLRYLSVAVASKGDVLKCGEWMTSRGKDEGLDGFKWTGGTQAETNGIWLWSKPFVLLRNQKKVAVLLMDTQGTFDFQSTKQDCVNIFALSTLLSSVQIYNLSLKVREDDLEHLQLFAEYGKLVKQAEKSTDIKPFQTLLFLVRDWACDWQYSFGSEGGKKYLTNEVLQVSRTLKVLSCLV